ncbi:MAG: p-hydroxycinnamoyl-CoA synthetase, partial [Candidatus Hodarchaeota archaeon]
VVGMPDKKWGEVPFAFVALKEGSTVTEADLKAFMQTKIARYKVPKKIAFLEKLPLTSAGKVDRRALERQALKFVGA